MQESSKAGENRWAGLYPAGTEGDATSDEDMLSLFRASVAAGAASDALIYFDAKSDFAALDRDSDAFAAWLHARGVGEGDRVMIVAQNVPGFVIGLVAAWKLGAVPVPANPMYRAVELARIFADAAPGAVLCQTSEQDESAAALELAGLSAALAVLSPHAGQSLSDPRALPPEEPVRHGESFEDILVAHRGAAVPERTVSPDTMGLILYTSGTTGVPKGAMLSHRSLAFNARFVQSWCNLDESARMLAIAPFFHITGLVCHVCAAIVTRCGMILNYRFEPGVVADMIRRWQPTFTIGAITAFNALCQNPNLEREDMASLRMVFSGGAPIPPALKSAVEERLGIEINPAYGMTETAAPAVFAPPGTAAPVRDDVLAVGIPIPGTMVRIVGDDGEDMPPGEPGEVWMRGPHIMLGYWNKPAETAEALRDGWMLSGDIGVMDEQGWVYLVDRKKDCIIASGFKVWPREVEDVLYAHPAVREAAVIGVADAYRGETVKEVVSLRPGATATSDELGEWCKERLAAYKIPRQIEFLDELPKTVSGKIQRQALRV